MIAKTGFPEYLESIAIGPNADFLKNNTDLCHVANQFETEVNLTYLWKQVERNKDTLTAAREFVKNFMIDATSLDTEFLLHCVNKVNRLNPEVRDTVIFETREALKKASTIINHPHTTTVATSATPTTTRNFNKTKPIHEDSNFLSKLADLLDACDSPCDYFSPVTDKIGSLIDFSRHNSLSNSLVGDMEGHTPPPIGIGLNVLNKIPSAIQKTLAKAFTSAKIAIDNATSSLTNPKGNINFAGMGANGTSPEAKGINYIGATNSSMFHDIMGMYTNMQAKLKANLQDCYRTSEFINRYNSFNPEMNLAKAQERYFNVLLKSATGERQYSIGASGQAKYVYENNQTTRESLVHTSTTESRMYDDPVTAPRPAVKTPPQAPSLKGTATSRDITGQRDFNTNDASKAIVKAALRNIGRDTSTIPNTQQGNVACAASVNIIVTEALGYPAGGGLATAMMYPALKKNTEKWQQVSPETAVPGSIIISPTDHGKTGHVGIIVDTSGNIVSNSSGTRKISQNFTISRWRSYYEGKQTLQTYAFTHTGPVNSSVQESLTANPSNRPATGISDQLVNFVKGQEGFTAKATWDYQQWSVGYGTVAKYPNEVINEQEAANRLHSELEVHASSVDSAARNAGLQLTAGQRDALISYSYNTGAGKMKAIINSVNGDANKLSSAIGNGIKTAGGKVLTGLANRRAAEARLAAS